jgi:hypothetical protein
MRFQTPQFIEIEDKIFGPLTAKQFVYLAGGGGLVVLAYLFLPFYLAIIVIPAVAALAGALAFYQVNNKPFIHILEAALRYFTSARLYLWKKREKKVTSSTVPQTEKATSFIPTVRESTLTNMSWNLTVEDTKAGEEAGLAPKEDK